MSIDDAKKKEYVKRLMVARMKILANNGFYGLMLMHMGFALDETIETAATDGKKLFFAPAFLDDLTDSELVFILQHEILHVVLKHVMRTGDMDNELFNIACDIVVNSYILYAANNDLKSITLSRYGESMHKAPNGNEGSLYTAEEVYKMLQNSMPPSSSGASGGSGSGSGSGQRTGPGSGSGSGQGSGQFDDHSKWGSIADDDFEAQLDVNIKNAYEASQKGRGTIPAGLERMIGELVRPKTDWRTILTDFVQEEIVDYSFAPPDRRFSESPFFLPDFNEKDEFVRDILFMVDTSGSMSSREITQAFSELKGAIEQFNGKLEGWLGFFDASVTPPQPFADINELEIIRPVGGGGTDFEVIFDYVNEDMSDKNIASIIILTDGLAPFPDEEATSGIPVLWMINNDVVTPPWGKIARLPGNML